MEQSTHILTTLALRKEIRSSDFPLISRQTFARHIEEFLQNGFMKKVGAGAGTHYIRGSEFFRAPIDTELYFSHDQEERPVISDESFFTNVAMAFTVDDCTVGDELKDSWSERYTNASETIKKKEFERITIELAWKSSKIEGNTYSLLDTERLLKERAEAVGHPHEEAVMIVNHKNALNYIREHVASFRSFTRAGIEDIHSILTKDLPVERGLRKSGVGIVGTDYKPKDNIYQIGEQVEEFVVVEGRANHVLNKAFTTLVLIAYIQPFADGNKRTSRMLTNAVLLSHGYPPLSFRSIDEIEYKKAIILCYENNSIHLMKKLFWEQYQDACINYFAGTTVAK